ncbi:hypothetical protein C7W88_21705 (plasmid) [Novosphingobium sp. THN1]|nr:hypothetical protein C7W88_21705 [Novosphingobium sp. THN1]
MKLGSLQSSLDIPDTRRAILREQCGAVNARSPLLDLPAIKMGMFLVAPDFGASGHLLHVLNIDAGLTHRYYAAADWRTPDGRQKRPRIRSD